ncbi:MAG: tetratricopeptide repeat protein [Candidatus Omnitrophota bacterium]|nr:tetratricopeptide repeat protein [Candidatus Omnitrophota bacterium]
MTEKSHFEIGQFLFLNEKYDQAIVEFKKAVKQNPEDAEIFYNLGIVYEAKSMLKEAREFFEKALELDPKHKLAEQHFSKLVGM